MIIMEVYEVHVSQIEVDAETAAEAIEKWRDGDYSFCDGEVSQYTDIADERGYDGIREIVLPDGTVIPHYALTTYLELEGSDHE
jgi:hypothetical protein